MCGIAGFIGCDGTPDAAERMSVLRQMTDRLRHRGPDDEGYFVEGLAALGHRRLSIIDLETGAQPMRSPDGTLTIVFNGEIYNFRELRRDLEAKGHVFRTRSDTEVIIHAYAEYGDACLDRFNGMFAFAIWDARQRRLFAARDRIGKKPFYYALRSKTLIFASELTAMLAHPLVTPVVTPRTISRYLGFGYVPAPDSIYEGIYKLPPAHKLVFQEGHVEVAPYWCVDFERADLRDLSLERLRDRFLEIFADAVRLRLVSDVPLGVFLSGGIDSSAVVAMMCELMPPSDVKTFTIAFREASHDESEHARLVARHFRTDHHEETLDERQMLERLPALMSRMDEPFADPSLCPTSLLSEFARRRVTVALGGDGGDELFAGYTTFWTDRMASMYSRLPRALRNSVIEPTARSLLSLLQLRRLERSVDRLAAAADTPETWRITRWSDAAASPEMQRELLACADTEILRPETLYADTIRHHASAPSRSRLARLQYQFQMQYLPDDILTKVDRASMAYALEVRAPFLDPRVVDFANALPDHCKMRGWRGKAFLRYALAERLPRATLRRKKMGFGIPLAKWLRSELRNEVERLLAPDRLREQGIFRPEPVEGLLHEHLSGRHDNSALLWTLAAFQLWYEQHRPSFRS